VKIAHVVAQCRILTKFKVRFAADKTAHIRQKHSLDGSYGSVVNVVVPTGDFSGGVFIRYLEPQGKISLRLEFFFFSGRIKSSCGVCRIGADV
jgi:hypothetical protein